MECHFTRVNFMVRTIVHSSFYTKYWESSKDTSLSSFFNTFTNCWDVFLWNSTTNYSGIKFKCLFCICIHWLEVNFTVTVLSTTTRLFCILAIYIYSLCKCFLVSNLWSTYICFYLEFTKKSVYNNFQM